MKKSLHPIVWGKHIFSATQRDAYLAGKGFLNRKQEIFEWLRKHHTKLCIAIKHLWKGGYVFHPDVLEAAGIELKANMETEEIILSKGNVEVEYSVEFDIAIWSARPDEIHAIKTNLWNTHIIHKDTNTEHIGDLEIIGAPRSSEGPNSHYFDHTLAYWN